MDIEFLKIREDAQNIGKREIRHFCGKWCFPNSIMLEEDGDHEKTMES